MGEGILLCTLFDNEVTTTECHNIQHLDDCIRRNFRDNRTDLMGQYRNAEVIIHSTPGPDYIVFNEGGEDLYIQDEYVYLLSKIGAKLMASKSDERALSFHAEPGIVGYISKEDPELGVTEPANEDIAECKKSLAEFESYYDMRRKSPEYRRGLPHAMAEIQSEFLDLLRRISGYEPHQDREFNRRIEDLIREIFPKPTFSKGITFSIRATEFYDTAHPERFQFLDTDGKDWYVFVSDWDQGFSDTLGMLMPVSEKVAAFLKRQMPKLPIRR
jgi:hypothetical protein